MKAALRARQKERLSVLRGLKSDFKYKQIEVGHPLTDADAIGVLSSARITNEENYLVQKFTRAVV